MCAKSFIAVISNFNSRESRIYMSSIIVVCFSETGSLYVVLTLLGLTMHIRLVSNSRRATCLSLLSARIKEYTTTPKRVLRIEPG